MIKIIMTLSCLVASGCAAMQKVEVKESGIATSISRLRKLINAHQCLPREQLELKRGEFFSELTDIAEELQIVEKDQLAEQKKEHEKLLKQIADLKAKNATLDASLKDLQAALDALQKDAGKEKSDHEARIAALEKIVKDLQDKKSVSNLGLKKEHGIVATIILAGAAVAYWFHEHFGSIRSISRD